MQMNSKEIERWEKTRQKGRQHFIWLYGVACWGLMTGILWGVIMHLVMPFLLGGHSFLWWLLPAIIAFPIGGYVWGYWMWKSMEKKYQQTKAQENS